MDEQGIAFLSLTEQARLIERREISPVELLELYLDRISAFDDQFMSYITVSADLARSQAQRAADEITAGQYRGPLHGLPFGVKDQLRTKGVRTTLGFKPLDGNISAVDATVISRLYESGAILVGKHNLDQFGKGGTLDWDYGQTRNCWNPEYSPAGSSSGSGVAVGAGFCSFALGEDTGGSVRNPASANGVVGLRPTFGLVSRHGGYMYSWTNDTIGPITRSVADASAVLSVIGGYDERDPLTSARPIPDYAEHLTGNLAGVRVGVIDNLTHTDRIQADVQHAVDVAVDVLRGLGASVGVTSLRLAKHSVALQMLTADVDVSSVLLNSWMRTNYEDMDFGVRTRLAAGALVPAVTYSTAMRGRAAVRQEVLDQFDEFDVLVCPTNPTPPKRLDAVVRNVSNVHDVLESVIARRQNAYPFSVANVPALTLPCGFGSEGLPVGLQVVGRPFDEATVFRVGDAYERVTPWHSQHPDVSAMSGEMTARTRMES